MERPDLQEQNVLLKKERAAWPAGEESAEDGVRGSENEVSSFCFCLFFLNESIS